MNVKKHLKYSSFEAHQGASFLLQKRTIRSLLLITVIVFECDVFLVAFGQTQPLDINSTVSNRHSRHLLTSVRAP